jgi:hypothetical protein
VCNSAFLVVCWRLLEANTSFTLCGADNVVERASRAHRDGRRLGDPSRERTESSRIVQLRRNTHCDDRFRFWTFNYFNGIQLWRYVQRNNGRRCVQQAFRIWDNSVDSTCHTPKTEQEVTMDESSARGIEWRWQSTRETNAQLHVQRAESIHVFFAQSPATITAPFSFGAPCAGVDPFAKEEKKETKPAVSFAGFGQKSSTGFSYGQKPPESAPTSTPFQGKWCVASRPGRQCSVASGRGSRLTACPKSEWTGCWLRRGGCSKGERSGTIKR